MHEGSLADASSADYEDIVLALPAKYAQGLPCLVFPAYNVFSHAFAEKACPFYFCRQSFVDAFLTFDLDQLVKESRDGHFQSLFKRIARMRVLKLEVCIHHVMSLQDRGA